MRTYIKKKIYNWLKPLIIEEIKGELYRRDQLHQKVLMAEDLESFAREFLSEQ